MKILEKIEYKLDFASVPHKRMLDKPNEDRLLIDKENGIFIILDGVTRVHKEYEDMPYESAAREVGDILLKEVHSYILKHLSDCEPETLLREAIRAANEEIRIYRQKKNISDWVFYPSTLGIISILQDNKLHYISVGDCLGVLLRRSSRILFGREFALEAIDLNKVTKQERYEKYCNHPKNKLSYTVYNGDEEVMDGIEYSFIDIHEGDTVILASDGIGEFLKYEKCALLKEKSAEEMILLSEEYDLPPYAEYADDKTLLKLSF